jgi:hypothetical protein
MQWKVLANARRQRRVLEKSKLPSVKSLCQLPLYNKSPSSPAMAYRRYDSTVVAAVPVVDADAFRAPSERTAMAASSASPLDHAREKQASRRLPTWFAYPLSIILSPALSALLYSFVPDIMGAPLAAVSRSLNEPWQIGGLLAWRLLEITLAWSAGLDRQSPHSSMATSPSLTRLS